MKNNWGNQDKMRPTKGHYLHKSASAERTPSISGVQAKQLGCKSLCTEHAYIWKCCKLTVKEISQHSLFYWPKCLPSFTDLFLLSICLYTGKTQVLHIIYTLAQIHFLTLGYHCHTNVLFIFLCVSECVHILRTGGCLWVNINYQKIKSECRTDTRHPSPLHYVKSSFPFSSHHIQSCSLKIGSLHSF